MNWSPRIWYYEHGRPWLIWFHSRFAAGRPAPGSAPLANADRAS